MAKNQLWVDDTIKTEAGIFDHESIPFRKPNWTNKHKDPSVKYLIPYSITKDFEILAIWSPMNSSLTSGYIGQFCKHLETSSN